MHLVRFADCSEQGGLEAPCFFIPAVLVHITSWRIYAALVYLLHIMGVSSTVIV